MPKKNYKKFLLMVLSIFLFSPFFVFAQVDSVSIHESSDTTIVAAEQLDSTVAKVEPTEEETFTDDDRLIANRLKVLQNEVKLTYNKKIRSFIDYFIVRNRNYSKVMARRKNVYFPVFEDILKREKMPDEIKYLAIVESGLNPKAISPAGAAGLWQFMPYTGKQFGLYQDEFIDERMDASKATVAACKYLRQLYNIFHDWELALASYNCGPGNVRRAIRKSGYKETFWQIYNFLPKETRGYVPQFVALTYTMNHMGDHGIFADSLLYPIQTESVVIDSYLDTRIFAEQLNICYDDLIKLNPFIKKGVLSGKYVYSINIPIEKMSEFLLNQVGILDAASQYKEQQVVDAPNKPSYGKPTSTQGTRKLYHTVRSGESLGRIAAKYNVTISDIKRWNHLSSNTIRTGQRLIIYKKGTVSSSSGSTTTRTQTTTSSTTQTTSGTKYYTVRPGDSLWTISQKFPNLTVDKLKKLNGLKGNSITPGQKLKVS